MVTNMIQSLDVANYFLLLKDEDLTHLKIQKMVYYAYGWYLAQHGRPLFDGNAQFEAWNHGPVIPNLYQEFKKYKGQPIPTPQNFNPDVIGDKMKFLDEIYTEYGYYSASQLRNLTHAASTPWYVVYKKDKSTNYIINDQLIKVYFTELIRLLHADKNMDQFSAAKALSEDKALSETMYVLSCPKDAQELTEALERSAKGDIIQFDWRNAN